MKGIDISSYQGVPDFKKIKASGIEIVIIKATQGIGYTNPNLMAQYKGAVASGLKIGFYHFLTNANASLQAIYFLKAISTLKSDCKYVIDVEDGDAKTGGHVWTITQASSSVRIFADVLKTNGKIPCIYTGDYFFRDKLNATVKDIPLWVARYGGTPFSKNIGVQYSDTGKVAGIVGNVDMDTFTAGILLPVIATTKVAKPIAKVVPKTGKVTGDLLNVREKALVTSKVIGQLEKGTTVKIEKKVGNFYSIYYGNHGGYVSVDYIK